ncbi:aconitase X, partial [Pseudomonas aeruginosa]|uniref:aconitase X n=1 Tax=Pseudomonas aeruginosa TaxID=287 RepID=UPI0022382C75
ARLAMRIVLRMAALQGAQRLVEIQHAHIDACIYTGPAGLRFAVFAGEQGLVEGVQSRAGIGRQRFGGPGLQRRRGIAVEFQA